MKHKHIHRHIHMHKHKHKLKLPVVAFVATLVISIGLLVAGFVVPPTGVIDGSVLSAVGELLGFAAIGQIPNLIQKGGDIKIQKGNTTIEIDNPDELKKQA